MNDRPVVVTAAGAVRGRDDGRVAAWRGIRYAEPPTGARRWRAPVPAQPWTGVADAERFGPAAPQRPNPSVPLAPGEPGGPRMDEDCLFLNVVRPSADRTDGRSRPVMVWLHGGAYAMGSSSQLVYHGETLAVDGDVVIVTLNYRLGALGFLDLAAAGVPDTETNRALRDVLLALRWVQHNIAAFGGDPGAVTLFGQSAGAGLVIALLASPLATGLFHRAIAQSPPAGSMYGPERSAVVTRRFVEHLGTDAGDVAALRETPVDAIVDAAAAVYTEIPREHPGTLAFAPGIGDDVLPESPLRVLSEGRGLPVPLIVGTNRDEATLFRLMRSPLLPIRRPALERMFAAMQEEQARGGPDGVRLPPPAACGPHTRAARCRAACEWRPTSPSGCPRSGWPPVTAPSPRPTCTASTSRPDCSGCPVSAPPTPPTCRTSGASSADSRTTRRSCWAGGARRTTSRYASARAGPPSRTAAPRGRTGLPTTPRPARRS
ncbi:carboxylesterase/lipase family protein [Leifsonia poae]|uniref:carboxylesterase/lipase family protein n=1 Tax=Leifsonia poae TaxID=110933 RepID=UPI003D68DB08